MFFLYEIDYVNFIFSLLFLYIKRQRQPYELIVIAKKPYGNDEFTLAKML